MLYLWHFCLSKDADQDSSGGISTTQSTLEAMRTTSRNGTIRSGTIPSVQMYVLTWLYVNLCQLTADMDATKIVVSTSTRVKIRTAVECV